MTWLMMVPVSGILFRAVYTDVKKGIIENRLLLLGMITGFLFVILTGGKMLLWESIKSTVVMFAALFFLYMIKGLGAGDVKLICVLAVFFQKTCFKIVVIAFFVAAFMAIGKMIWRFLNKKKIYQRRETLRFSIPVAVSTLLIFLQEAGICGQ
ncbi:MAG: A24 family peptidase [Lachnospiraceae bacterium]|nr:A24 family peptidase [Lachnospiraceae bacterium]